MKHWKKLLAILVIAGAFGRYWYLYSKHLDTAQLVAMQICVMDGEALSPINDMAIEMISDQLIARKLAGDGFIERAALKSAIVEGLTCEQFPKF